MSRCLLVAITALLLVPTAAQARAVRLMYETPDAIEGGSAVAVTYEDQREAKKGGKDPTLIANERGAYGAPTAVRSGAQGTKHAADVVPAWAADVLRSAGYDARVGEDASLPRVHVVLKKMWGDEIPLPGGVTRANFTVQLDFQVFGVGATEPGAVHSIAASGGTTTVMMRFDDPVENGFVRTFDEATKSFALFFANPKVLELLPGGNPEAAAAASQNLGPDRKKATTTADGEPIEQGSGATMTAEDLPDSHKGWDPEVYEWGGKGVPLGFLAGGIGLGLTIGGDQWARALAVDNNPTDVGPAVLHAFSSLGHIPLSSPEPEVGWVVQSYVSDIMFSYGTFMTIPSFGITVPTLVAASSGADLQTTKAVMGFSGAASYIPTGVFMIARFGRLFPPQWAQHQTSQDRWHHLGPGIFPLVMGIVDFAMGGLHGVFGVLYATGAHTARVDEKGLFAPATAGRRGLSNQAWMMPTVTPTADGGLSFGVVGRF